LDTQAGTTYVTTGGGGSNLHDFNAAPWFEGYREATYHYVRVNVDGGQVHLQAIGLDGRVMDDFSTDPTAPAPDTTPPAQISDLALASCTLDSCGLSWTAPGDDGLVGQASSYDLRYSTAPITTANWTSATNVAVAAPLIAGSPESHTVAGLLEGTSYYFAIRASDEVNNTSVLSNVASGATTSPPVLDTTPPAAVADLTALSCTVDTCELSWTATGDDDQVGQAASYDLRYATAPITVATWDAATPVSTTTPQTPGTAESASVPGLAASTTYYFAVQVADEAGNLSGLSNVPSATTSTPPPTVGFSFLVYGNSRAGSDCSSNAIHSGLVTRMAAEPAAFGVHLGDMITGYNDTTTWAQPGSCSDGSFRDLVAPLTSRPAAPGLPTFLMPSLGNHDDNWGSGWYPDALGDGICEAFDANALRQLIPNHTRQPYFRDQSGNRLEILDDAAFYSQLCSTVESGNDAYPDYFYYSFDHENVHFVVLRISAGWQDMLECDGSDCSNQDDYTVFPEVHQLHWLQDDLQRAAADSATDHVVVFLHTPVFSSGDNDMVANQDVLARMFSDYGVDVVFSGDNHNYERTVPILATASAPGGQRDDLLGTTYVVSGGGGSPLEGFGPAQWFDALQQSTHHYVRVHVSGGELTLEAVDDSGTVIDTFTLNR